MIDAVGVSRSAPVDAPALHWPPALIKPARPPKLVYLDMKDWINLSHVTIRGAFADRYRSALEACRAARAAGTAIFPIAGAHYMELAGIGNPNKRRPIADLMEELSGFTTMLSRQAVMRMEVEALFIHRFGPSPEPSAPFPLLNFGAGPAFGKKGALRVRDRETGRDITDDVRAHMGADRFDAIMKRRKRETEWRLLAGPTDAEAQMLHQAGGWDPDTARKGSQRRADQEQQLRPKIDGTEFAKGTKLHDVVLAREVYIELMPALAEAMEIWGISEVSMLMPDKTAARALARSMPTSEVASLLKTQQHRTNSKMWKPNDIFDIDAMSEAVPYCDIVVTDANRWDDLRRANLDSRMNTVILRDLSELPSHL